MKKGSTKGAAPKRLVTGKTPKSNGAFPKNSPARGKGGQTDYSRHVPSATYKSC